jgi:predicted adenine nucleotide alpha hydrolase (AANH) superfamily ATPase
MRNRGRVDRHELRPKLLLHACCGVCSSYVPEVLIPEYDVTLYFENSNIWPSDEFRRRAHAARVMAGRYGAGFVVPDQDKEAWFRAVRGHASDPENGERCRLCIAFRLEKTFAYAKERGFDAVATTLGVSRTKRIEMISEIGNRLSNAFGIPFLDRDWKKKGGEGESQSRSKNAGIYRQVYCGCVYSLNHGGTPSACPYEGPSAFHVGNGPPRINRNRGISFPSTVTCSKNISFGLIHKHRFPNSSES